VIPDFYGDVYEVNKRIREDIVSVYKNLELGSREDSTDKRSL